MKVEKLGDDIVLIEMPERLDAVGVASIETKLAETIEENKGKKILVDMGNVNFVASLALRMLLSNQKAVSKEGGELRLSGLQSQIAEVFRKSRFDTIFKIHTDRAAALEDLQAA